MSCVLTMNTRRQVSTLENKDIGFCEAIKYQYRSECFTIYINFIEKYFWGGREVDKYPDSLVYMSRLEPLEYFPLERWVELQRAFKADWPRGISGYAALEVQRRWKEQEMDYDFKVYCPFGDVSNGMVAVNVKDSFYEIIIQCPKDDTKELEEALLRTKIIDWNQEVCVPYASRNVVKCLKRTVPALNVEMTDYFALETFILESATFDDVTLPSNVTLGPISLEDLDFVDSAWLHRYSSSKWYFHLLIKANYSYGLYLNNALISWVFFKESGALLHLYTVAEHRGKGYAELLLKLVGKIWLKTGLPVFAFCLKDNAEACRLYKRVGFVQTEDVAWCYYNKAK